jgi:hypothetical protein
VTWCGCSSRIERFGGYALGFAGLVPRCGTAGLRTSRGESCVDPGERWFVSELRECRGPLASSWTICETTSSSQSLSFVRKGHFPRCPRHRRRPPFLRATTTFLHDDCLRPVPREQTWHNDIARPGRVHFQVQADDLRRAKNDTTGCSHGKIWRLAPSMPRTDALLDDLFPIGGHGLPGPASKCRAAWLLRGRCPWVMPQYRFRGRGWAGRWLATSYWQWTCRLHGGRVVAERCSNSSDRSGRSSAHPREQPGKFHSM